MEAYDPDQGFPPGARVRKHREFDEVYQKGARIDTPFFVLYHRKGTRPSHRLGMTVSKRIGKACVRNRVKRLFRDIFRKNKPLGTECWDIVLNARKSAATATRAELEAEYRRALARLTAPGKA
ncbi:MAG: ribonuclease P protein component [Acidobacteria bacterium]|nr:ribonuclease P protein component [Acidobacteriota bacterium]